MKFNAETRDQRRHVNSGKTAGVFGFEESYPESVFRYMTNFASTKSSKPNVENPRLTSRSLPATRVKQVIIIQNSLAHYRVPFFEALKEKLTQENINLRLLHGRSGKNERFNSTLSWAEPFNTFPRIGKFVYHPVLRTLFDADLIIVEDAARLLINYFAFLIRSTGKARIALWGHGRNHQAENPDTMSERVKEWLGKRSDWYFAYTADVKDELISRGFSNDRITDVRNAIEFPIDLYNPESTEKLRRKLSIPPNSVVANYCGRMYPIKQIGLLIDAAELVIEQLPTFRLILGGGGVDQHIAEAAAREHAFIDYVGPVFGKSKSALFGLSDIWVMPGSLGLGILDAFQYSTPPIIVKNRFHSPEIAYVEDNVNGLMVDESPEALAAGICRLSTDHELYARLKTGCEKTAGQITVGNMAQRFATGVAQALKS